jgi:hypothetical protein
MGSVAGNCIRVNAFPRVGWASGGWVVVVVVVVRAAATAQYRDRTATATATAGPRNGPKRRAPRVQR